MDKWFYNKATYIHQAKERRCILTTIRLAVRLSIDWHIQASSYVSTGGGSTGNFRDIAQ
jgi:hypothetical protein